MSNILSITEKLDDWRVVSEFYTFEEGSLVVIWGNYRKNSHEIEISLFNKAVKFNVIDMARLQDAIKKYEERD